MFLPRLLGLSEVHSNGFLSVGGSKKNPSEWPLPLSSSPWGILRGGAKLDSGSRVLRVPLRSHVAHPGVVLLQNTYPQ